MWDVFISHAWEDKEDIARPLAEALKQKGLSVWYDEFTLTLGDSLRRSIDRGLAQSRYGIVILSPHFFAKEWPQRELDGLVAKEVTSGKVILPVWHNVTREDVGRFSPTLADKLAVPTAKGLDEVVEEILRALHVDVGLEVKRRGALPESPSVAKRILAKLRPVNWKRVRAIAGVIGVLIVLGAWLVPSAAVFLSAWLKEMIYVPAGEFRMGSDGDSDEQPAHTVYLDAFYIDKYEVTNAQYRKCVEAGVCGAPVDTIYYDNAGYAQHPVVYVSWDGADAYCRWAGKRMPTEAEWEKACRGTTGWTYPWGEGIDCDHAQYSECGGRTVPVGSKPTGDSLYGAWDMAGNVWEWVADWYDSDYYSQSPARNPPGPDSGEVRVLRGGSWQNDWWVARCPCRSWHDPRYGYDDVGFRCARGSP